MKISSRYLLDEWGKFVKTSVRTFSLSFNRGSTDYEEIRKPPCSLLYSSFVIYMKQSLHMYVLSMYVVFMCLCYNSHSYICVFCEIEWETERAHGEEEMKNGDGKIINSDEAEESFSHETSFHYGISIKN